MRVNKFDYLYAKLLYKAEHSDINFKIIYEELLNKSKDIDVEIIYEELINKAKLNEEKTIDISEEEAELLNLEEVTEHDYSKDYLTFTALEDTTFTFTQNTLQYSLDDGNTWTTLAINTASPTVITGNKIMWKQTGLTPNGFGIGTFSSTGNFEASGNIMSLYYGDDFAGKTDLTGKDYAFCELFNDNTKLVDVENLVLSATTLASYCYFNMFYGCTSLTTAPTILPAITLADSCYIQMFTGCTSLIAAPKLPATTLADYCYGNMFSGCTSLMVSPKLPATILAQECYNGMFEGCIALTTAPELPATTLTSYCYACMFIDCTSLTIAPKILPATTLTDGCYGNMFQGCTSLTTAPELPATILVNYCYDSMFKGCTNLNYIKCLAITISSSNAYEWVEGIASIGTFVKNADMTSWTTGSSGIPKGWTVQELDPNTGEIVNEYIAE